MPLRPSLLADQIFRSSPQPNTSKLERLCCQKHDYFIKTAFKWPIAFACKPAKARAGSGDNLVEILLETGKHRPNLVRSPEIRNGVGDRVVVLESQ